MISEIDASNPKFIIDVHVYTSWLVRPDSQKYVFEWFSDYVRRHYILVGIVDMVSPVMTIYKWYGDVNNYNVLSQSNVLIFERRT
jgi:hypothetical protein